MTFYIGRRKIRNFDQVDGNFLVSANSVAITTVANNSVKSSL